MLTVPGYVAGEEIKSDERFVDLDPSTGEPLAEVARLGAEHVDAAVAAARAAYGTTVRKQSAETRSGLLVRLAGLIRRDADRLAELESRDVGKPLRQATADVLVTARYFEFYAGVLRALHGDTLPPIDGAIAFTKREPFGVTGHITPWNYPLQMLARSVAPALAAGNCSILKPAEDSPITAVEVARLADEAGFPPGMLNVVTGFGAEAGAALAGHPGIDHVSFTGSRPVGQAVATAAAVNVVPVVLELGRQESQPRLRRRRSRPRDTADRQRHHPELRPDLLGGVARARPRVAARRAGRAGEGAVRGHVHRPGPGRSRPRSADQRAAARSGGDDGVGGGRGRRIGDRRLRAADRRLRVGVLLPADVVRPGAGQSPIGQQEVFGPVLAVSTFADDDEAVQLANATEFGLVAAVWTRDVGRAHRVADAVRAGQVFVNTYGAAGGIELPFGGWKRSGYGREKGVEGLIGYTQTKTVVVGI